MKYQPIDKTVRVPYCITGFSDGISKTADTRLAGKCGLSEAENVINKNGALVKRPALRAVDPLTQYSDAGGSLPFKLTDTVYYRDGKKYNIAYYSEKTGSSYNGISVYLVSDKNNVLPLGFIYKTYDGTGNSYRPESVVFLTGASTVGLGIYAFVSASTQSDYVYYDIFEAVGYGNSMWAEIRDEARYVPTVLINGRGNYYSTAQETLGLQLDEPAELEKRNMLCSSFKAYFSSDGYSWSFSLPEKGLDETTVNCKVYFTPDTYINFNIPVNGSDTKTYNNRNYTAFCNLTQGRLYFFSDGVAAAIPRIDLCPQNNIIVTARKTDSSDISGIITCRGVVFFNSRAYLYKSATKPNTVYSCRVSNPLYFPKNSQTEIGAPTRPITAAGYQNDKLIVFNDGETYKVNTTADSGVKEFDTPAAGASVEADVLSSQTISTKVGCGYTDTVASCAGQLIWVGADRRVYTLEATTYGSEKNIFCISEKINDRLASDNLSNNLFAAAEDGYYYLFSDNKVFVCDCHITNMGHAVRYGAYNLNSVSWYLWSLAGGNYTSCKSCGSLMATAHVPGSARVFLFQFEENIKDRYADYGGVEPVLKESAIPVSFTTADIDLRNTAYKGLTGARFEMKGDFAFIKIITDKGVFSRHIHSIKREAEITVSPHAEKTGKFAFSVSCSGDFALKSVTANLKR